MAASAWRKEHCMRTSTRVRNALIGVASATALTGGALAVTAAPASPDGPGVARVLRVWLHRQVPPARGLQQRRLHGLRDLGLRRPPRHASRCGCGQPWLPVEWATVTDTNRPDRAVFWIYDRGIHALEVATTERATFPGNGRRPRWSAWPRPRRRRASRCASRTG